MFRATLGLATATFIGLAASPAFAGCCGSNWGWGGGWGVGGPGWGVNTWGCCSSGYAGYGFVAAPPPVVVQAPPQQVFVQPSQPEVIYQQAAYQPPSYTVDQGPYYSGPNVIGYPQTQYYGDAPVRPYPYVSGGYYGPRTWGRPYYRGWRGVGYRGYRGGYVYRGARVYRGGYGYRHPVARGVARGAYINRRWN